MSGSTGSQQTRGGSASLSERDVCIGSLYGSASILILRHPPSSTLSAHLDVYSQGKYVTYIFVYIFFN